MQNYFFEFTNYSNELLLTLIIFIGINYITSIFIMIIKKKWLKEKLGIQSILSKIGCLFLIYIAHIIGIVIIDNASLSNIVITFYISREGLEILGNLNDIDVPLPSIIVKIIQQLNNSSRID